MPEYQNSILSDPSFMARLNPSGANTAIGALQDRNFVKTAAVALREGNDLGNSEYVQDLNGLTYGQLSQKYGREVADNRGVLQRELSTQQSLLQRERGTADTIIDTGLGAAAGVAGIVGSLGSVALEGGNQLAGALGSDITAFRTGAQNLAKFTDQTTQKLGSLQSQLSVDRRELSAIEDQLDSQDSQKEYERDIASGKSETDAGTSQFFRDLKNSGERVLRDPIVLGDTVANAIGSLGPSAKLAGFAAKGALKLTGALTTKATTLGYLNTAQIISRGANAVKTAAVSGAIGLSEASSVYTSTVNNVMEMSHDELMVGSKQYREYIAEGVDPLKARSQIASDAGMQAFATQFPTAAALGILTARFEAAPLTFNRGGSFVGGLRQVGAQFVEEAAQGGTGQLSENAAIQANANAAQTLSEGVGGNTAIGAIAGAGIGGVVAAPSVLAGSAIDTAGLVKDAVTSTTAADIIRVTKSGATKVVNNPALVSSVKTVGKVTTPVINKITKKIKDASDKSDPELQAKTIQEIDKLKESLNAIPGEPVDLKEPDKIEVSDKVINAETKVKEDKKFAIDSLINIPNDSPIPDTLKTEGIGVSVENTLLDNIQALLVRFSNEETNVRSATDSEILYANEQFTRLKELVTDLRGDIRVSVKKILSSEDIKRVKNRIIDINNNTQNIENIKDTQDDLVRKAKEGLPIDPKEAENILNSDTETLSTETLTVVKAAKGVSEALNNFFDRSHNINENNKVLLSRLSKKEKEAQSSVELNATDITKRSIRFSGFKTNSGNQLDSLNDMAAKIIKGVQNSKYQFINDNGRIESAIETSDTLRKLATHMINKVGALNKSKELEGKTIPFTSLSAETGQLIEAGEPGNAPGVRYHPNNVNSTTNAQAVLADAIVAVETYNALYNSFSKEHPKLFPKKTISILKVPVLNGSETSVEVEQVKPVKSNQEEIIIKNKEVKKQTEKVKESKKSEEIKIIEPKVFPTALPKVGGVTRLSIEQLDRLINSHVDKRRAKTITPIETEQLAKLLTESDRRAGITKNIKSINEINEENYPELNARSKEDNNLSSKFNKTYIRLSKKPIFKSAEGLLDLVEENINEGKAYINFVSTYYQDLIEGVEARLDSVEHTKDKGSVRKYLLESIAQNKGILDVARYENTVIIGKDGKYDQQLLGLATIAFLDYLSSAVGSGLQDLDHTMRSFGLTNLDITKEQQYALQHGVTLSDITEAVSKDVLTLWNVKKNKNASQANLAGIEGIVKELISVMINMDSSKRILRKSSIVPKTVKETKDEKEFNKKALTMIIFNGEESFSPNGVSEGRLSLYAKQEKIGKNAKNAVKKLTNSKELQEANINKKIDTHPKTYNNSDVPLSNMEKKASKNVEDTAYYLADASTDLWRKENGLKFEDIRSWFGWTDLDTFKGNDALTASVEGKNNSIQYAYDSAIKMIKAIENTEGENSEIPVYFRAGYTSVGRLQMKGVNPQTNKMLRVLLTPTHATLNMSGNQEQDRDDFWIGVAQASEIYKVENIKHESILANIETEFNKKYSKAVQSVLTWLKGGTLNKKVLEEVLTGKDESDKSVMQRYSAIVEVAKLYKAIEEGTENQFKTSLSFELDGKTDGPGNMLANFGQGVITALDHLNFKRVGYFLGSAIESLNSFFSSGDPTHVDMYEFVTNEAQADLYYKINNLPKDSAKRQLLEAEMRFAAVFGDFRVNTETNQIELTRTTAKNPVTKLVYGAGLYSIAKGISDDMVMEFYSQISKLPEDIPLDLISSYLGYPIPKIGEEDQLQKDIKTLFGKDIFAKLKNEKFIGHEFEFNTVELNRFANNTSETIAESIQNSAKDMMGKEIINVNEHLILATNIQYEFVNSLFFTKLEEARSKVVGKSKVRNFTQREFDSVVKEMEVYSAAYFNGNQRLSIGDFKRRADIGAKKAGAQFTNSIDEKLGHSVRNLTPDEVRTKVIAYITQGRGDGMMINRIYSANNAPTNTTPIFDGIDMSVKDRRKYSEQMNQAVYENWQADVLGDLKVNFENFMRHAGAKQHAQLLEDSFTIASKSFKKKSPFSDAVEINNPAQILEKLRLFTDLNNIRTEALKPVPTSVDHLGGSENPYIINEKVDSLTLDKINEPIIKKIAAIKLNPIEASSLSNIEIKGHTKRQEFTAKSEMVRLLKRLRSNNNNEENFDLLQAITAIRKNNLKDVQVIKGPYDILVKEQENLKSGANGYYDTINKRLYLVNDNDRILVHELVHAATYDKVLAHYSNPSNPIQAVVRLETLMKEFLSLNFSQDGEEVIKATNSAISTITNFDNSAQGKANAINEFMAYSLTDINISKVLKETKTTLLSKLTRKVLNIMKKLMGVQSDDMFSHIAFNTKLLNANQKIINQADGIVGSTNSINPTSTTSSTPDIGDATILEHRGEYDDNSNDEGQLTTRAHQETNYWINLIKKKIELHKGIDNQVNSDLKEFQKLKDYHTIALDVVDALSRGGFSLSDYQARTFKAIHMVLATEMELDTQSAIALNDTHALIVDKLTPEMFGTGTNAQLQYATVLNLIGNTKNQEGISDAIAIVLALSQTTKDFRSALDQLPKPPQRDATTLNNFLTVITGSLFRKAIGTIDTAGEEANAILDNLAENLIKEDSTQEFSMLRGVFQGLNKGDDFVATNMRKLAGLIEEKSQEISSNENNYDTVRTIANAAFLSAKLLNKDESPQVVKKITDDAHMGTALSGILLPIRNLIKEVGGATKIDKPILRLLNEVNKAISQTRNNYVERMPVHLKKEFNTAPDASQWKALFRVIGTSDFQLLYDQTNPDGSMELIFNEAARNRAIKKEERIINSNYTPSIAKIVIYKSKQLSKFMNKEGAGHQLQRNAYAINKLSYQYKVDMTSHIDRLITLYTIRDGSNEQREAIKEMYENDSDAVKNLIVYLQGLNQEEDQKEIKEGIRMSGYKGYIPDKGRPGMTIIIENDNKKANLIRKGFTRLGDYKGEEYTSIDNFGYYFSNTRQTSAYSQGTMQTVQDTYRGVSSVSGLTVGSTTSGVIFGKVAQRISSILENKGKVNDDKEVLLPVYDFNEKTGTYVIKYYEKAVSPDMLARLEPKENLALMIGSWAGRQVEEKLAQEYNVALVDSLKEIYDDRAVGSEKLFVNIADPNLKDKIYKDAYDSIPTKTRKYIDYKFPNGFFVRKDMVDLALGYRNPSIIDVWTGVHRMPEAVSTTIKAVANVTMGKRAIEILTKGEDIVKTVVSTAKDLILVRSLIVPYMNTQANVVQLWNNGVPNKVIYRGYKRKFSEIDRYNENTDKIFDLENEIRKAGTDQNKINIIEKRIAAINSENSRMSIAPMIKAGEYKNISEGITEEDLKVTKGKIGEAIEEKFNSLPKAAQTIINHGLLAKGTPIYELANKGIQYGDFVGKSIYYDFLINKGVPHIEALDKVSSEFVNFSPLPGRVRQGFESLGLSWFMTFKIRIAQIAMRQIRDNPVRSLLVANTLGEATGGPINDNIFAAIEDGSIDHALGFGMIFSAAELNPYFNVGDWLTD